MSSLKRYSIWNSNTGGTVGNGSYLARNEDSAFNKLAADLGFESGHDFAWRALGMTKKEAMRLYTFEVEER